MSRINAIADNVTSMLVSAKSGTPNPFSLDFTAMRVYIPRKKPADLVARHVFVVPVDSPSERAAKNAFQEDYEISLAIQYKPEQGASENNAADAQLTLAEKIIDFFRDTPLTTAPAQFVGSRYQPMFDDEHLDRFGVLTTVIVLIYRAWV